MKKKITKDIVDFTNMVITQKIQGYSTSCIVQSKIKTQTK